MLKKCLKMLLSFKNYKLKKKRTQENLKKQFMTL